MIVRYIIVGKNIYPLTQEGQFWYDDQGVKWALRDDTFSLDKENLCGIDPLSLPDWHIFRRLNEACAVHDFLYSNPTFQYFHSRAEAEFILKNLIEQSGFWSFLAIPFSWLASKFGGRAWENEKTR